MEQKTAGVEQNNGGSSKSDHYRRESKRSVLAVLYDQLKGYRALAFITPVWMLGEVVAEMVIPILMGRLVDNGVYKGNTAYVYSTGIRMLIVAVMGLFSGILGSFFASRAGAGLAKNLRKAMFDNIQTFSFENIDHFSPSSLVTRMTTDVQNVQNAFQMLVRGAMRSPSMMIVAMVLSFVISPRLASIYLVAVLLLAVVLFSIMRSATKYFSKVFERYDDLNESVEENVQAIRVVKAYVREDHEITRFQKAAVNIYTMFVKAELNLSWNSPIMSAVIYTCILLISWFGAHMVVGGSLTTGELMSLLTYCMNILNSLMFLTMIFVMLTMSEASCRRIAEVITAKSTITNPASPVTEVRDGSIEFDHVTFSYNVASREPVLRDINISIKSGENIGIIGGTGSSKSTLVNLISRLYDVTDGSVKVGGIDVRQYDLDTLRNNVSVVLQKNVLFSGTILDNLRWGDKNATEEECRKACEIACADEFIDRFPDGYNTWIEQGGTNVSGGQKQRLCIARALLKKPKVLIFDDSTSAVDTATDAKIRQGLAQYMKDTTKLVIAQRISSVMGCDRILVLDNGTVSGFGTHDELMKSNKIYREVYESQAGMAGDADFDEKK
jgi:ATP-binding cassette subfamily B multidrug efflux pump